MKYTLHYSAILSDGSRHSDELDHGDRLAPLRAVAKAARANPAQFGCQEITLWITNDKGEEQC